MNFLELSEQQLRQQINSESLFLALSAAKTELLATRGSMFWHEVSTKTYLIRKSDSGAQTSLGIKSPETELIYKSFSERKSASSEKVKSLKDALEQQQRINKATRVGRVPSIVVSVLNEISKAGLEDHFAVVGTNALFAYETRCGVRIGADAMVTDDVDLFFHSQKYIKFLTHLERSNETLIGILQKADKTFKIREDQLYTAINSQGYQVDFIRRPNKLGDTHPMKMAGIDEEEAIWTVQVPNGEFLESAPRFEQIVSATNGVLAKMKTISPSEFVRIKRIVAADPRRDIRKAKKDAIQANIVEKLIEQYQLIEVPIDRSRGTIER